MTGIERLRAIAGAWDEWGLGGSLTEIADQIEREHNVSDREEHEAAVWVRDHGGIDYVRAEWRSRVPRDRYERRRQRLLGHIAECETALGRRREIISKLTHRVSDLTRENAELRKRAMPEGYEWPRYESGEPLRYEDRYVYDGREREVWHVDFDSYGEPTILNKDGTRCKPDKGERVERLALDAEGNRIEPAIDVWWVCEGDERGIHAEKMHVESIGEDGLVTCDPFNGGTWVELESSELYVNRPVLDADGAPVKVGDTVYDKDTGDCFEVDGFSYDCVVCTDVDACESDIEILPSQLTHTRPEPSDSWDALWDDIEDCAVGYESFMRRCRALTERERGE